MARVGAKKGRQKPHKFQALPKINCQLRNDRNSIDRLQAGLPLSHMCEQLTAKQSGGKESGEEASRNFPFLGRRPSQTVLLMTSDSCTPSPSVHHHFLTRHYTPLG